MPAIAAEFDLAGRASKLIERVPWSRYVAMGDSGTEGLGDPVPGYPDGGWARMLADALRSLRPDLEFHNLGRRNLTTREIRATQLPRALELEPDLVSVVAGGNDMLAETFEPETTEVELDAIITAMLDRGATVYTCTMFDIFEAGVMPDEVAALLKGRFDDLNRAVRNVAERHRDSDRLAFDDAALDPRGHDPEIYSEDLRHANMRGHAIAAEIALDRLAAHAPLHA